MCTVQKKCSYDSFSFSLVMSGPIKSFEANPARRGVTSALQLQRRTAARESLCVALCTSLILLYVWLLARFLQFAILCCLFVKKQNILFPFLSYIESVAPYYFLFFNKYYILCHVSGRELTNCW